LRYENTIHRSGRDVAVNEREINNPEKDAKQTNKKDQN